jgi:hypothetical protein
MLAVSNVIRAVITHTTLPAATSSPRREVIIKHGHKFLLFIFIRYYNMQIICLPLYAVLLILVLFLQLFLLLVEGEQHVCDEAPPVRLYTINWSLKIL